MQNIFNFTFHISVSNLVLVLLNGGITNLVFFSSPINPRHFWSYSYSFSVLLIFLMDTHLG